MSKTSSLLFLGMGALVTLVAAFSLAPTLPALLRTGSGPVKVAVAGAPEGTWIALSDAKVRCESRVRTGNATYFHASAADGSEPFVVQVFDDVSCEDLRLDGGFLPGLYQASEFRSRLKTEPPPGAERFRVFSEVFRRGNLQKAVTFGAAFLALGAVMLFGAGRAYLRAGRRG
jgi:hypothetical protein